MDSLSQKVAVITGASSGIGRAIALSLAHQGVKVVLAARRANALENLAEEIKQLGGQAFSVPTDVGQEADLKALVDQTLAQWDHLDVLINNAGVYQQGLVEQVEQKDILHTLQVNLVAPLLLTKYALPHLKKANGGAVINLASVAGLQGFAGGSVYAASKHGLIGFTESLFEEVREQGIKVCAICPGFVKTAMVAGAPGLHEDKMIPPEDIGELVVDFLKLSAKSSPTRLVLRPQFSPYH